MLETQEDSQKNRDFIIEPVEWCFVVFVFAIERPDVGGDEVEIILRRLLVVLEKLGR
jgi:hypothetical protein